MNLLPSFNKNFQTASGQITAEITPVKTKDGDLLFFPKQLEQVLGYEDLTTSVRTSKGFIKDIDYIVIENDKLKQIKNLCNRSGSTTLVNNQAKSAILLTESGFYAVLIKSKKPEAVNFRVWVTKEVLPAIRKTGKYEIPNSNFSVKQTFSDYLDIAKMCKIAGNQAILAANKATKKLTGQDPIALLEVTLPSPVQITKDPIYDRLNSLYKITREQNDFVPTVEILKQLKATSGTSKKIKAYFLSFDGIEYTRRRNKGIQERGFTGITANY